MARYCLVVTITAADSGAAIRTLFGLPSGTGLKDYVVGRDADETGQFQRWVLAQGGVAATITGPKGTPVEVDTVCLIAFNSDVSATIRTRIGEAANNKPSLIRQLEFNPPLTRPQMVARLSSEVGSNLGCDHYWATKPGDNVTTGVTSPDLLLAKFSPVP